MMHGGVTAQLYRLHLECARKNALPRKPESERNSRQIEGFRQL